MPYWSRVAPRIAVALEQSLARIAPDDICVAIDVLRATTTLAVLFGNGCVGVALASSTDEALRYGRETDSLVCGEDGGLPPPGFDFGNSPVELSRALTRGRAVCFATTNGTNALRLAATGYRAFSAAFVNLGAATNAAWSALTRAPSDRGRLVIIAAGTRGAVGIEDVCCAGAIVQRCLAMDAACVLDDGAEVARRAYESIGGAYEAVRRAAHAQTLIDLGLGDDVAFCGQLDITGVAPEVSSDSPWPLAILA